MADIDVVPKGRTNVWAWIVMVLVILAALILWVVTTRADSFTASQQFDPSLIASWIAPASTKVPG